MSPVPSSVAAVANWVSPHLVGTVRFREFTGGSLRHPSWTGLRNDKEPGQADLIPEDLSGRTGMFFVQEAIVRGPIHARGHRGAASPLGVLPAGTDHSVRGDEADERTHNLAQRGLADDANAVVQPRPVQGRNPVHDRG
ncbi:hypothetical protein ACQP1O_22535 [Nocardia sp. CA-151230]|uniref:ATP dependent DNA ligase n=1 Tax=Nocardia sp. CA-151230 TaxID=3239982 RepID=UPI003D90C300